MPAKFISIGDAAHDAEKQALRFLVDGLPSDYTVYGNAWLVDRNGGIFELDAVVVAPHALFVVEMKAFRGRIEGTDHDWYIPHPIPSPLKLNRLTAQVLKSQLKRESYRAGQLWVEGLIFLSQTTDVGVRGPASKDRIHTRKSILAALQDVGLIERLSNRRALQPTSDAEKDVLRLLTGVQSGPKPVRKVREYEIEGRLDHHDSYTELLGRNTLSSAKRVLRIYNIPPLATDAQRQRIEERARWEATVLGRLGRTEGILAADPPFADEAGIVLPLEHFEGITLTTWIAKFGPDAHGKEKADLRARTDLWMRIAKTLDGTHEQGVVHRLLRPAVILVEDKQEPRHIRVTGLDLAKQLTADTTLSLTTITDDRLIYAAPEVVASFSSAEPASDQYSLGAILALMLTGKPLFESTRQYMAARRLMRRVRDVAPRIPLSLDEAVERMVALRATDRYGALAEAIEAVRVGRDPSPKTQVPIASVTRAPLDADDLQPGTRVGADYEIVSRLGQGGMAVVYAARHLVSGKTRALKIARSEDSAEGALLDEFRALSELNRDHHPNIVEVIDLTKMVEGRLTLVMERVGGETLRQWLTRHPAPERTAQRRLAEDLLAGLDYLEHKGVTHKDLKPENLLVSDGQLIIIDFSLAKMAENAAYGGTALYRDPASASWTHATDRFAVALCLFELYAGRHAFEGRVPEPGQAPLVREDDIEPSGLAEFFRKALNPVLEQRFPSARAMRDALLVALGEDEPQPTSLPPAAQLDATTPLRLTGLSRRALNALARSQVHSVGELLALSAAQVRALHALGTKTANDIISFQDVLRGRGIVATNAIPSNLEPALLPDLADSPEPVSKLPLSDALRSALGQASLPTVGSVASLTRSALLEIPGIGKKKLAEVVDALHQFRSHSPGAAEGPHSMDRLWELASRPLTDDQRIAVERSVGLTGEPETQTEIADDLGKWQPQVSTDMSKGLERIDMSSLADVSAAVDMLLDGFGGIARVDEIGHRIEEEWPAGVVTGAGMVRLVVRMSSGRAQLVDADGIDQELVAGSLFDRDTLRAFAAEVVRLAGQWPPIEPDTARRTLSGLLPHFDGDPLALGVRLCGDVQIAETGHMFIGPLDPKQTIGFVLDQARDRRPVPLDELQLRVRKIFSAETPYPDADHLLEILHELDCRVQGQFVLPGRTGSIVAAPALSPDEVPLAHGAERTPEEVVRDMLKDAATSRGFRMLVTPPERHPEIGRSVALSLGGGWLSFEDAFFSDHRTEMASLERAERFVAQRDALSEAAESTLFRLLDEHGKAGNVVVLGDTALFGLCEALDLPRRLYDETLSGDRGFWVLVVPGVIHNRQPRFNEDAAMWHLEGATLPLLHPLPG